MKYLQVKISLVPGVKAVDVIRLVEAVLHLYPEQLPHHVRGLAQRAGLVPVAGRHHRGVQLRVGAEHGALGRARHLAPVDNDVRM